MLRKRIISLLHSGATYTATQIQQRFYEECETCHDFVSLGTVSGLLKKMVDANELVRVEEFGIRKGYGYRLPLQGREIQTIIFDEV